MDCLNIDRESLFFVKLHVSNAYTLCEASSATSKGRRFQSHGFIVTLSNVIKLVNNVGSELVLEVGDLVTVRLDNIEQLFLALRVHF